VHVLYVDDDPDARALLTVLLEAAGASVVSAASAEEAALAFERNPPDILLSDTQMPERDGWALVEQLRSWPATRGGRTPAIAVTASTSKDDIAHSYRSGFDAHVSKPIELDELIETITRLVRGAAHVTTP
jgi:hypothetical protein